MAVKITTFSGFIIIAFCCTAIKGNPTKTGNRPVVTVEQGELEGIEEQSRDGRTYFSFLGIPYGKQERFQYSEESDKWEGKRDASKFGADCLQMDIFNKLQVRGEEDCLFLNVYTPQLTNGSEGLPTMVYLHGGGFRSGSGSDYGAKYFMNQDVVLITINYRLGALGLTDTGFGSNFGLKDQVLALKWIKKNVAKFGGRPDSITIFGESAGGVSVSLHLVSPLSKGTFQRGISMSGTPHNPLIPVSDNPQEFQKLGNLMGCPSKSSPKELLDCLKAVNGTDIITKIIGAVTTPGIRPEEIPQVVVTIEKPGSSKDIFMPDYPVNLLKKGEVDPSIPWINGVVTWEGFVALGLHPGMKALYQNGPDGPHWNAIAPKAFSYADGDDKTSMAIKEFYFKGNESNGTVPENFANLLADYTFIHPAKASAVLYAKVAPVYMYHFALKGVASYFNDLTPPDSEGLRIPAHGDELQYLFNYHTQLPSFPEIEKDSVFAAASDRMIKLWVSFAKDGNVSPDDGPGNKKEWKQVPKSGEEIEWKQLDKEYNVLPESTVFGSRLKFWDDLSPIKA